MQLRNGQLSLSPSHVTGYLGCEHLTTLAVEAALGELGKPEVENEQAELVFRKGREHEAAYLARLRADGKHVVEIELEPDLDWDRAVRETEDAIRAGVDVVYQGALAGGRWRGVADFLERQPDGTYEAVDTKLARHAKPAYILQLCFYSERLARIQASEPKQIHVLLGNGERVSFRPQEFAAYARRVRARLERFVDERPPTRAYPCGQCGICDFKPLCDAEWISTDSLCLVAGVGRREMDKLEPAGILTATALAQATEPAGLAAERFLKVSRQAALQLRRKETNRPVYELLQPCPDTGFALLPDSSPGDLFLDLEGNPFWDEQGSLEYLWGVTDMYDEFTAHWADDHQSERRAFDAVVDLIHDRLAADRALHVYHYAGYEVKVLRRLAARYGTREAEVDDLLRRGVLVDLLKVVRGGLQASVPSYGLKEMEVFLDFPRLAEIRDGGTSIVEYERFMQTRDPAILESIAAYNREDCIATRLLRDWLLDRRAEALERFGPFPAPEPQEPKETLPAKLERAALREALLKAGHDLAAQLVDYHDRERKPIWWAFFDRLEKSPEELIEDAESIALLEPVGPPEQDKRSFIHRFLFPAQEHKFKVGHQPFDQDGEDAGKIVELDREGSRIALRRGPKLAEAPLPQALIPGRPYYTDAQEDALMRIGHSLLAGDHRYPAVESVLAREPFDRDVQTTDLDEMAQLLLSLDGRHLVIQGPPGSGKTWVSGRLIARLLAAGKRVGVASTSHKAIHKLLDEVEAAGIDVAGIKKATAGNPESFYESDHVASETERAGCLDAPLAGGTAWLFAHDDLDRKLDYLFVDEAGQVSLADALAMGTCAHNLVLVGDPQQLAQVLQASHPDGAEASVLQHLLGDDATIPADRGLFLERTYRLHPDICGYISEEFYERRLSPDPVTETRTTPFGTGLRWLPVEHTGRRQESPEEVEVVAAEVERLLAAGVGAGEIKVVSPYNAQANVLRERLAPTGVEVGTVDKFQGQEARVVLYSVASSSGEDVPRGLEFLLSRNRLNVAISRAQCLAYLVCSPRLLEVNCRTIEQMRLANALCRFVELAS
jgi:uncharacterized protein